MLRSSQENILHCYPEVAAGGFSRVDGTVGFYSRINALVGPDSTVMDLGAGRGAQLLEEAGAWKTRLCTLQGKVAKVVGMDVDPAVLSNPFLDEAHVVSLDQTWPFADDTFDLIYADWVLEHVANPREFAAEARRVLKPGGWLCARTPNRWGMVGLAANMVPNRLHTRLLAHLQPDRKEIDVFPTTYLLNSKRAIRRYFPRDLWDDFSYVTNSEPPYVQRSRLAMRLIQLYWRLTPQSLHTARNIFLRLR